MSDRSEPMLQMTRVVLLAVLLASATPAARAAPPAARELEALLKGGVQRLYLGNLKVGPHELVAFFNGKGPNERAYKRGASLRFEKGVGAKYLELKINDRQRKLQPEFEIKDWE